jgi:hypothetical protein
MIHTRDIVDLLDRAAGPNRWAFAAPLDVAQWHLPGSINIVRDGNRFYLPATISCNRRKRLRAHQILDMIENAANIDPDVAARLAQPA